MWLTTWKTVAYFILKHSWITGISGQHLGSSPVAPWWRVRLQCRRHRGRRFDPCIGKISRRRKWQPTTVFLPGESHRPRSSVGCSLGSQRVGHHWATEHTHTQGRIYCCFVGVNGVGSWDKLTVWFSALPTVSCVTLGKSLKLFHASS